MQAPTSTTPPTPPTPTAAPASATSATPATSTPAPVPAGIPAVGASVTITEAAAKEIAKQRDKRGTPEASIRIGVRGGGCTGFSYVFEWAEAPRPTDNVIAQHGVSVVIDPKSMVYLRGLELDFVTSMMGHGFKFNNPNAKGNCGCGESVQF